MLEIIQFPKNGYVVIQPTGVVQVVETETQPTLEEAQAIVGGLVQMVPMQDTSIEVFVNEEGLLFGMEYNAPASAMCAMDLVGPALILCGSARWGDDDEDWEDD